MRDYIVMIILKPDVDELQMSCIQSNIITTIKQKCKVNEIWHLGNKELDHKIKKYTNGVHIKLDITGKARNIEKLKEELRRNRDIIFSIIMNNESKQTKRSIFSKYQLPMKHRENTIENKIIAQPSKKVYMLVSRNLKLPFAESAIIATSDDENRILPVAYKKLQELIYVKGYHTQKPFKQIKEIEKEFKSKKVIELILDNNPNLGLKVALEEQYLI